jgi:hypothetical protein
VLFGVKSMIAGASTPTSVYQNLELAPDHLVRYWGYARNPYPAIDEVTAIVPPIHRSPRCAPKTEPSTAPIPMPTSAEDQDFTADATIG